MLSLCIRLQELDWVLASHHVQYSSQHMQLRMACTPHILIKILWQLISRHPISSPKTCFAYHQPCLDVIRVDSSERIHIHLTVVDSLVNVAGSIQSVVGSPLIAPDASSNWDVALYNGHQCRSIAASINDLMIIYYLYMFTMSGKQ